MIWRSVWSQPAVEPSAAAGAVLRASSAPSVGPSDRAPRAERTYRIHHETIYRYERPVETSSTYCDCGR